MSNDITEDIERHKQELARLENDGSWTGKLRQERLELEKQAIANLKAIQSNYEAARAAFSPQPRPRPAEGTDAKGEAPNLLEESHD
jgi:hypothetical protein